MTPDQKRRLEKMAECMPESSIKDVLQATISYLRAQEKKLEVANSLLREWSVRGSCTCETPFCLHTCLTYRTWKEVKE